MSYNVDSGYPALLHTRQAQPVRGHYLPHKGNGINKLDMWATLYYFTSDTTDGGLYKLFSCVLVQLLVHQKLHEGVCQA